MAIQIHSTPRRTEAAHESYPVIPFRLLEDYFNDWSTRAARTRGTDAWKPVVDVLEKEGNLILRAELPGMNESDIDLKLEGNILTIKGERKLENGKHNYYQVESAYGAFSRSFSLPETVDTEHIQAAYRNGILSIAIPQRPEVKPRIIRVSS